MTKRPTMFTQKAKPGRVEDRPRRWLLEELKRLQGLLDLERERNATITFLNSKLAVQKWHSVARCAMDLAEIEAELLWAKRK